MNTTEKNLKATLQKSYYGKAKIRETSELIILKSYNTDVLAIRKTDNKLFRLWNGWSVTTNNHINDFLLQHGFNKVSKKEWLLMPCVNSETTYNIYYSTGFFTHKSNIELTESEAITEVQRIEESNNGRVYAWYE